MENPRTPENNKKYKDRYKKRYPERVKRSDRNTHLKRKYGISVEQYDAMLLSQNGLCKICGEKPDTILCVDHCHKNKKVRGLLCNSCNLGIGHLRHSDELLNNAIAYLKGGV